MVLTSELNIKVKRTRRRYRTHTCLQTHFWLRHCEAIHAYRYVWKNIESNLKTQFARPWRSQDPPPSRPQLPPFNAKHVIAAKEAAEKNQPVVQEFSHLLVGNFASGRSSGSEVQRTAASALNWCEKHGGNVEPSDVVHRIAGLGSSGKYSANCERDMHTMLNTFGLRLHANISAIRVRMYNHTAVREELQTLSILYPDDLAEAIFAQGENIFRSCMFGNVDAAEFWAHCATHCEWFKNHAMYSYECKEKLIPLSLYGDDVNTYRNAEVGAVSIIAWTSDFGYLNKSCLRYWPICVYSEHCSTEHTHEDIMRYLTDRLKSMCSREHLFGWSSKGYCFMFSSLQGDLKWIHEKYGLHNFRANACCNRVLHDCMHSQLLGTGKVCNGSVLIYLAESGLWGRLQGGRGAGKYDDCLEICLRAAHQDFLSWKKQRKINTSQARFTPARCSRKSRQQYPALNNKAAASKACTMWLAERASEFAARAGATEQDQLMCTTIHSYASALILMDEADLLMSDGEATKFYDLVMRHLQTHALLNKRSRLLVGKAVGRNMWLIMPKHHHLFHAAHRVRTERVNPRAWALFAGEDFVGR
ncbi:unnamed protein product, partial [Durusdinium trenchii]